LRAAVAAGRGERLAELASGEGLDALLVNDLTNIRYLTGFGGTNALCLVGAEIRLFFTDFRYTERARRELVEGWEQVPAERELLPSVVRRFSGRVGYDDANLSVRQLRKLEEGCPDGVELVPAGGLVERLRRHKDEAELAAIAEAARLADEVYGWVADRGLSGRSEREVARAAEARIRELDAEPAFPVIVAAGENGAQPHAEPGEREIATGDLVVFDMGAQLDGYCSDCTRTLAVAEVGEEEREVYELALAAQAAALDAVAAGTAAREVDAAARSLITDAGRGDEFGHPTGHGVGIEVHEAPRLAPNSDEELGPGEVVTIEPGIYLEGRFGVRIEDLVVVTEDGHRNLSGRPKDLTPVG
jgi:Xaa-Pro aminopeptidase